MKKKKKEKKKKTFFHACLISPISYCHVSRLSHHSCRLMNEQQSLYDLVLVEISLDYDCLSAEKTVSLTESDVQTFLEPKYENKNWNLRFQWPWWQHLKISTEIDIVRFATGRFQPSTSKISSFSKDKVDLWEIFTLKITPIVVFVAIQRIVLSWALASTHFTILIRGMSIVLLSFVNKVGFSCQWRAIAFI